MPSAHAAHLHTEGPALFFHRVCWLNRDGSRGFRGCPLLPLGLHCPSAHSFFWIRPVWLLPLYTPTRYCLTVTQSSVKDKTGQTEDGEAAEEWHMETSWRRALSQSPAHWERCRDYKQVPGRTCSCPGGLQARE